MSQAQRDFAFKCIEWGEKNYGMGHTLAGIGWMESSLGADTDHGEENSIGEFGLGVTTSRRIKTISPGAYRRLGETPGGNFKSAATTACLIYFDNIRYIKQWHRNRGLTVTDHEAWQKAAQVYPGGTSWVNRKEYGRVFRIRVAFLMNLKNGENNGNLL